MRRLALAVALPVLLCALALPSGTHVAPRAHPPGFGAPSRGQHPAAVAPSLIPTVEMFDSVEVGTVPGYARVVAGYTSGSWPTYLPLVAAFPRAHHVSIAISVAHNAKCLDIEPGDAQPWQAGSWDRAQLARGVKPCNYTSLAYMPAVKASIAAAGIARSRVFLWDADWTYHPGLDTGYDATQWSDHALGRNLDESTVSFAFAGIGHAPPPKPRPRPKPPLVAKWKRERRAVLHRYHLAACRAASRGPRCSAWRHREHALYVDIRRAS